jgi:Uma2 family endonuclease
VPASPAPAKDLITFDEFCALIPDGQKADLIDGVIYVASPDSKRANETANFLITLTRMYVSRKKLGGQVYGGRFAFQLSLIDAPEPDAAYVSARRMRLVREGRMDGGPDVAIEVVTRDSRTRDYLLKRRKFEEAGVLEYWIIDAVELKATFLRLGDDGKYHKVRLEKGRIFRSKAISGFWLDVRWVCGERLADESECLEAVLAS